MASTLNDTALSAASSSTPVTTVSTVDALAVTLGDLVVVEVKWEGANGATCTVDTGASTPTFDIARPTLDHANNDFHGGMFSWIATATGTVTPRAVFSAARPWVSTKAYSFTPGAGLTLQLDTGASAQATGAQDPSSGAASATAAGIAVATAPCYFAPPPSAGSGWTIPAEFASASDLLAEHRIVAGAGSITGNFSSNGGSGDWIAQMAIFKEVAVGGSTRPVKMAGEWGGFAGPSGGFAG